MEHVEFLLRKGWRSRNHDEGNDHRLGHHRVTVGREGLVYLEGASRAATWRELPRCWPQGLRQQSPWVSTPSRLVARPAQTRTMHFVQSSAFIPSRPPALSDMAAWSGSGPTYHTPAKADAWPGSRLSISHHAAHRSLSPVGKRRLRDRRRAVPSGQSTRGEEEADDTRRSEPNEARRGASGMSSLQEHYVLSRAPDPRVESFR